MLPRIASLDDEFNEALRSYIQRRARRDGIIGQLRGCVVHEGHTSAIQRTPTDYERTKNFTTQAETTARFDEIDSVDVTYIIGKANEMAEQFAKQLSLNLFRTLDEVTTKTGQVVDGRGAPMSNEMMMEMFSKMTIDFEKSPHGDLTIVVAPQMASRLQSLDRELYEKPDLRRKMNELMDKKRNEFREREINRNLAG